MNQVKHDVNTQEFYVDHEGGKAFLHYEREGDVLDFHHTFVPPALRGTGIAEAIVQAAFDYASERHQKVIPSCPYVARLVTKRPEWKKLVVSSP